MIVTSQNYCNSSIIILTRFIILYFENFIVRSFHGKKFEILLHSSLSHGQLYPFPCHVSSLNLLNRESIHLHHLFFICFLVEGNPKKERRNWGKKIQKLVLGVFWIQLTNWLVSWRQWNFNFTLFVILQNCWTTRCKVIEFFFLIYEMFIFFFFWDD